MNKPFSSSPIWLNTGLAFVRCVLGGFLIYHGHEIFTGEAMNGYLQWDMFSDSSSSKTMQRSASIIRPCSRPATWIPCPRPAPIR